MSHKSNYDIHHLLPQKWKNELTHPEDINRKENKKCVKKNRHIHKHWKDDADTPAMVMMEEVKFNLPILKEEFARDLIAVFNKHLGDYYIFEAEIQEEIWKLFDLVDTFNHKKTHETIWENHTTMKK